MQLPNDFSDHFESAHSSGNKIVLRPRAGGNFNHDAPVASRVAELNPDTAVWMQFSGREFRVKPGDTVEVLWQRQKLAGQIEREQYEASPAGKAAALRQRNEAKIITQSTQRRKELASASHFQFPDDMPYLQYDARYQELEDNYRAQLSIGAQWLHDHPDAKPFPSWPEPGSLEFEAFQEQVRILELPAPLEAERYRNGLLNLIEASVSPDHDTHHQWLYRQRVMETARELMQWATQEGLELGDQLPLLQRLACRNEATAELEALLDDTNRHQSGLSGVHLMHDLARIDEVGFDGFIAEQREKASKRPPRSYEPPSAGRDR